MLRPAVEAQCEPMASWIVDGGHELVAAGEPADVAIVDGAMGPEAAALACRGVRAPAIVVNVRDEDVAALVEAGVNDVLSPPVTRSRLLGRLALFQNRRGSAHGPGLEGAWDGPTYRAVLDAASDGIFVLDRGADRLWRMSFVNPSYARLVRRPAGEITGRTLDEFVPRMAAKDASRRILEAVRARGPIEYEEAFDFGARKMVLQTSLTPIFDARGRCRRLVGTVRDVTEGRVAEEILHANEERLHAIVEAAGDGIIVIDGQGIIESFNPAAEQLFGYEAIEVLGRNVSCLMPEPFNAEHDGHIARYLATGRRRVMGVRRETVAKRADGSTFPVEISLSEMWIAGERKFTGMLRDVTERKLAEERFETLAERAPIGIYIAQDGAFQYVNPRFAALTGYAVEEVLGSNPLDIVLPEDRELVRENAVRMLKGQATGSYEYRIRSGTGEIRWIMENLVSLDYRGKRAAYGYYIDVTARKEAEAALRESEERYRSTFQQLHDVFYKTDETGVITMVSPSVQRVLGYEPEELLGASAGVLYTSGDGARTMLERLLRGESLEDYEIDLLRKDGTPVTVSLTASFIFGEGPDRMAIQGTVRDITERKRAQAALRESEERYRSTFELMHDIFYRTDAEGRFTMVSPSCFRQADYTVEEMVGKPAASVYARPEEYGAFLAEIAANGFVNDAEVLMLRKDGSEMPVSLNGVLLRDEAGAPAGIQGSVRDISERKRAEEERDRYFELSLDMLAVTDLEARFLRVNPAWERVLGYPKEKMIGRTVMRFAHPDHRQKVIDDALLTLEGQSLNDKRSLFLTATGEARWLSWNTSPVTNGLAYSVVRDVTDLVGAEEEQARLLAQLEENARVLTEQAAELEALREEAEYAANHDMLTGMLNRRAWFNAALSQRGTAVAVADIDHFKRINDTWGHPAGDTVLAEVARRMEAALERAVLGRVGGEEFAILFSCPFEGAGEACERVLAAVATAPIALPGGEEITVTVSVGLAPWRSGRHTREEALARAYEEADAALYDAKEAGRAQLAVAPILKAA